MKERLFRFKKFSVSHDRSAMKVGVDGVLIGAWTNCEGERLLDVGTGCGLIALMLAQRNSQASIKGIDVDSDSVEEALENVERSPWKDRIAIELQSFEDLCMASNEELYDLIVSNPPFYDAGVKAPLTPREKSRHQSDLSPKVLIKMAPRLLVPGGRLALIAPAEQEEALRTISIESDMVLQRICYVKNNEASSEKRVMMEFVFNPVRGAVQCRVKGDLPKSEEDHLVMFDLLGAPTEAYHRLCEAFYLRF